MLMINDLEEFIKKEIDYFEPMLKRGSQYSKEELFLFKQETISQRKYRVSHEVFSLMDGVVKYGPFKGLQLQSNPWWGSSDLGSMCLGLYEKEILDFLFSKDLDSRDTFIDIGAADGYYAVGMLHSGRAKKAVCFELSQEGQDTILENWKKNHSSGLIEIYGDIFLNFEEAIKNIDMSKVITLIDIEGTEFDFLNDTTLAALKDSIVVIEIHNWVEQFIEKYSQFLRLASKYFKVEFVERVERPTVHFEELRSFTDDNRLLLTSEARPCLMRFIKLMPL